MNLTKLEKETILLFNEQEDEAEIYTYSKKLIKKLSVVAERNPQLYKLVSTDSDGGVCYHFSKKLLSVRFLEPISQEERQNRSERAKRTGLSKFTAKSQENCESTQAKGKDTTPCR